MSLHFLFRDENHMVKALADPKVFEAIRDMIDQTVQGIHVIGLGTQGLRNMYSKKGSPQNRGHQGRENPRAGNRN